MFLAKICSRVSHLTRIVTFFSSSLSPQRESYFSAALLLLHTRAQIIHKRRRRAQTHTSLSRAFSSRLFIIYAHTRTCEQELFQSLRYIVSSSREKFWKRNRRERRNTRMSTPARKRLVRDFKRLQSDPPTGISGAPTESNIMLWHAVMFGPEDTPWEGGTFKLTLQFTEEYPNKAPTVKFVTKMFHPNIYADGSICLDILQNQWSPIYDVAAVLTSIQSLLCDPNPNSPANSEAATLFRDSVREYNKRVQLVVENSWME